MLVRRVGAVAWTFMENQSSPAAIAARIARRQTELADNVDQLKAELSPKSLAARLAAAAKAQLRAFTHDESGRLSTTCFALVAGLVVLVGGAIMLRVVKR
ncbi:MAG: DUF3618 domain-containing protein [Bifidobacteriaceae bacterium]|jgi:hypothetical protein|nr:DUF3618 domain-containing protein [Bifidobacteriaceae bacterium]